MTPTSNQVPVRCPRCGAPLADAASGLCLRCAAFTSLIEPIESGSAEEELAAVLPETLRETSERVRLGDYELIEEIGRGGMGVVWKARQRSLGRIVALKMLLFGGVTGPGAIQRFQREAASVANLQHPNIVRLLEVGFADNQHFFAMDYVAGPTLAQVVADGPLGARQAARYVQIIAGAIRHAHDHGILHRDLKPSNVLIDENDQPRVTDFGLAKRIETQHGTIPEDARDGAALDSRSEGLFADVTLTGQALGSPGFMAPEQTLGSHGKIGLPTDIYGIGAIFYFLLTGRPPFASDTIPGTFSQVLDTDPVPPRRLNSRVPIDAETICLKCLEKEPARRYQTAQALAADLGRFLNHEPIQARPVGPGGKVWRWCRRQPSLAATLLVLCMVLVLGLAGILWQWRRATRGQLAARQSLYAADMLLAQQALSQADFRRLTELLEKQRPPRGETDLRGWEWRYLRQFLRSDDLFTLSHESNAVDRVTFSPDGRLLAGGMSQRVKVWESATRRELTICRSETQARTFVAFSPDGKWLAAAEVGKVVRVWDTKTMQNTPPFVLQEDSGGRLAWSPDSRLLVNVVWGDMVARGQSRFRVWDVNSRQEFAHADIEAAIGMAASPNYEIGRVRVRGPLSVAVSPKAPLVAIGTQHGAIVLWDSAERTTLRSFAADAGFVRTVAFSPDGRWLASGGREHAIRIWTVPDTQAVTQLMGHTGELNSIAFSPDGKKLATASKDQTVKLWDTATWHLLATLTGHSADVSSVVFAPDGQMLATSSLDGTIRLWSANFQKTTIPIEHPLSSVLYARLAPDGSAMMTLNDDSTCSVWDPITGRQTARFHLATQQISHGAVARGGREVALGSEDGLVMIWEAASGRLRHKIKAHEGTIQALAFSASSQMLVTAGGDRNAVTRIHVWNAGTGERLASLCQDKSLVLRLAFSPNGRRVVATFDDRRAAVWDPLTGESTGSFVGHRGALFAASLSDNTLATAGGDAQAKIWNLSNGRAVATMRAAVWEFISCALSPDAKRLAAAGGDGSVRLWDLETQQEVANLGQQSFSAHDLAWTPDGNTLISVGTEKVTVWQAPSLEEIDTLERKPPKPPN